MARKDWYYVNLPKLMIKRLEQFLATPKAKGFGLTTKSELLRHAVNEFLDDQEDFYNNIQSIKDFILMMKERDHIILTYNTESELAEILSAFIEVGIKNNQINGLFISTNEEPKYFEVLKNVFHSFQYMKSMRL